MLARGVQTSHGYPMLVSWSIQEGKWSMASGGMCNRQPWVSHVDGSSYWNCVWDCARFVVPVRLLWPSDDPVAHSEGGKSFCQCYTVYEYWYSWFEYVWPSLSGCWFRVPWFALLVVLLEEKWFFCIASRRGSREVNILQVELAALLVLEVPALLLLPRWSHCFEADGVTLVSGEQLAGKLNDSKLSDMSHWQYIFLRAVSLNSLTKNGFSAKQFGGDHAK